MPAAAMTASDLVEDGAPDAAIMRDAGWKTPRMVGLYSRGAKARQGAMATRLVALTRHDTNSPELNQKVALPSLLKSLTERTPQG